MIAAADLSQFFGRFHPLLVHLPIGLLVLVGFLELLARSRKFKTANANVGVILALAVVSSCVAALLGWVLSRDGGYEERLLNWHMWTGIATAVACTLAAFFHWTNRQRPYRVSLAATLALLVVASHHGGSLTHGSDYLVKHAPAPLRAMLGLSNERVAGTNPRPGSPAETGQQPVFTAFIHPVLQENCAGCHGPEKSKGGLRVDSFEALLKGGDSGPGVVAGKPADSLALARVLLPLDHDDHMPPDGKPQPTEDDIAIFQWWIESGASADKTGAELNPPPRIAALLRAKSAPAPASGAAPGPAANPAGNSTALPQPKPLAAIATDCGQVARDTGVLLDPLSETEPWLQCNASIAGTNFGDDDLAKLAALCQNLRWLDLAGTAVTDQGLAHVGTMRNLTRLHLERTAVGDPGIQHLVGLDQLEYLNLYGTAVTDAALDALKKLPRLKQLYLWQTKVSPDAAKTYTEARTDRAQIAAWEKEIEQLKARIHSQKVLVAFGIDPSPKAGATRPVNTECPVSGKPVDATKTAAYEGKLVAFCCDNCKAKFESDPKPFLAKLGLEPKSNEPK